MVPDHDRVPGLDRPVSLSEYAKLEGLREADVLAVIGQLKISAAFFRDQWWVEAPRNCEARLTQLRSDKAETRKEGGLADWVRGLAQAREHTQSDLQPQRESRLSQPPRRDPISQPKPVRAPVPQPAGDMQETPRPQPVDYGLSWPDILDAGIADMVRASYSAKTPLKYKAHKLSRIRMLAGAVCFLVSFILISLLCLTQPPLRDHWYLWGLGTAYIPAALLWVCVFKPIMDANRKRTLQRSDKVLAYKEALQLYEIECKATHEAEMRKRSYWQCLDGYAFERATAEVLSKHQFNAMVTPGSGDGGIDIEVTRNGLKGVVQCKAHVAGVGPHVVRDLYGVIHHCGASFGIIASRGGFSRGAIDFARDKPILFLDTDDLIAMQEGRDVLAAAFPPS